MLVNISALAARWGVSVRVIYEWLQAGDPDLLPPALRLGRGHSIRFRLADIEAWEAAHVQPARARPAPPRRRGRPSKAEQLRSRPSRQESCTASQEAETSSTEVAP